MSATFITLSKRLTTLENNLKANRIIKPRYYLQEARNKLSEVLGERLDIWNVLDLVNEAKQPLWLNLDEHITDGGCHKLEQAKRVKIWVESKEYKTNPFVQDKFCFDSVQCIKFSNGLVCRCGDEVVTYDKTLADYVYLERIALRGIIAMFD
ncbi:MAG: hypothetical protein LW807_04665 [Proteobacteria bacterium]|nr:hypothetical protein [Pseudomonadota bacterium]